MASNSEQQLKKGSTQVLILAVLADGPAHGYAIAKQIRSRSEDALSMGEGALYPALKDLEDRGFVVSQWETEGPGPARKVYSITKAGTGELDRQQQVWSTFANAIDRILGNRRNAEPA
jgi:DNA-binding PadR family transcriptional regulator